MLVLHNIWWKEDGAGKIKTRRVECVSCRAIYFVPHFGGSAIIHYAYTLSRFELVFLGASYYHRTIRSGCVVLP